MRTIEGLFFVNLLPSILLVHFPRTYFASFFFNGKCDLLYFWIEAGLLSSSWAQPSHIDTLEHSYAGGGNPV